MIRTALGRLFGTRNNRYLKSIQPLVDKINALEPAFEALSDAELREKTSSFRQRFANGETLDSLLPEAFATVREASKRTLGLRHYDVQLMGGIILYQGKIAEMKTGEGKTLMATLAAYLNALPGKGVHLVTVNDYLAKRDAEWMGAVYAALGMRSAAVYGEMSKEERQAAYAADITYATNNELGFDYLRDNMAFDKSQIVQRGQNFAIVDEVDSILIDEARTPLIISGPTHDKTELYHAMDTIIPGMEKGRHYEVDEKARSATLTDAGMDLAEEKLQQMGLMAEDSTSLYDMQNVMLVHHLNQALRAHALFRKDVDYILKDHKVIIIDEFTGRMMPGRRYGEGLHQALEAKEGVKIQNENQTLASTTFQNYFRMYDKLAGMTGTADTEAEEFETIYGLDVIVVPTNVPVARNDEADIIYRGIEGKYNAIIADIRECYERGQPVLVGTTSIEKSEKLAEELKKKKIPHNVLNARYHEQEADIIAQAGRLKAVTIATNMAGRGVDIKLGGNLDLLLENAKTDAERAEIKQAHEQEKEAVLKAGGLRVIGTERHESRRIDNQLRGRSGRQGDPGGSVFYISLQDDLMRIFAKNLEGWMKTLDMPEDEAIQSRLVSGAIETAQRKIEAHNFDIRKNIIKFDDVLNDQRKVVYEQRREVMDSDEVSDIILAFRDEALDDAAVRCFPQGTYAEQWLVDSFAEEIHRLFNIQPPIKQWAEEDGIDAEDVVQRTRERVHSVWQEKTQRLGSAIMNRMEKGVLLQVLDMQWKDHLQRLDFLRQGIHLRGYGQKDPLNEFKNEAFALFAQLLDNVRDESIALLSRVEVQEGAPVAAAPAAGALDTAAMPLDEKSIDDYTPEELAQIPRNAPCPCGSGKKFKYCHGKMIEETAPVKKTA